MISQKVSQSNIAYFQNCFLPTKKQFKTISGTRFNTIWISPVATGVNSYFTVVDETRIEELVNISVFLETKNL